MNLLLPARIDLLNTSSAIFATSSMLLANTHWRERSVPAYTLSTQPEKRINQPFEIDATAKSLNPFLGIHAAVTLRLTDGLLNPNGWFPEQSSVFQEALESFTIDVTFAAFIEILEGNLAEGYPADWTFLEKDPFICNPEEMKVLQSSATMVDSDWVCR